MWGDDICISRKTIEESVLLEPERFIDNRHWQIFKDNFVLVFIMESMTIDQYFDWAKLEYLDRKSNMDI